MQPVSNSLRRARPLLGTFVEIAAVGVQHGDDAAPAIDAAFDAVALVHQLMSFHDESSDLSRLNREGGQHPVTVHPWTYQVLAAAVDLQIRSAGRFDIAVASALQALCLLPTSDHDASSVSRPIGAAHRSVILLPGYRVRLRHPGARIDLGGIAKGFAVDQALAVLRAQGMVSGFVNAGGDIAAFGPQSHRVHIRHPSDPARFMAQVDLKDEGLASSGPRFELHRASGYSGSAVIDPSTGGAVIAVIGASVRASTCMMADALTKPVMISPESSLPLLDRCRASALLVLSDGSIRATDNWREAADRAA